uniref:Uncharacterized protein n=1 Tax=Anopheles maculatus TaxID=74869 RepID=A0A182SHW9_9DIPT
MEYHEVSCASAAELTFSPLSALQNPKECVDCATKHTCDNDPQELTGEDLPKLYIATEEEDIGVSKGKTAWPSLYIGPPESSYSCDSISEFTPNLDDQELYISSFSESEDESEPSRYYSALGQHDCELDDAAVAAIGQHYLRRSLSYTFSNDPDRYNPTADEGNGWPCGRRMSSAEPSNGNYRTLPLMSRSFDELLKDRCYGDHSNCCCRYCWMSQMARFYLHTKDHDATETEGNQRQSRSLSPPCSSVRRLRGTTSTATRPSTLQVPGGSNVIRHDVSDHGRLRLVRYPVRAMARFASDPSLPLGLGWAEASVNVPDKSNRFRSPPGTAIVVADHLGSESHQQFVFVTLTTPPPDEYDSEPFMRQLFDTTTI